MRTKEGKPGKSTQVMMYVEIVPSAASCLMSPDDAGGFAVTSSFGCIILVLRIVLSTSVDERSILRCVARIISRHLLYIHKKHMTCESMTSLHLIHSDLSITSVGQRKARAAAPNNETLETTSLVLKDLLQDSRFFTENPARSIPSFRDSTDIIVGDVLGNGEFGVVLEVVDILVPPGDPCQPGSTVYEDDEYAARLPPSPFVPPKSITIVASDSEDGETKEDDKVASNRHANAICACVKDDFSSDEEEDNGNFRVKKEQAKGKKPVSTMASRRARVAARVLRDGAPRYALKRLRKDACERLDAILDLACEARFLECTTHTNIIRLRATVGEPGTASFGLVLDRLTCTLGERLLEWQQAKKKTKKNWLQQLIVKKMTPEDEMFLAERLVIALDIARALNFLHGKKILFRDLKPGTCALGFEWPFVPRLYISHLEEMLLSNSTMALIAPLSVFLSLPFYPKR